MKILNRIVKAIERNYEENSAFYLENYREPSEGFQVSWRAYLTPAENEK